MISANIYPVGNICAHMAISVFIFPTMDQRRWEREREAGEKEREEIQLYSQPKGTICTRGKQIGCEL